MTCRVIAFVLVLICMNGFAESYIWTGGTGAFQTDSNWSPVGVPGEADTAGFTTAGTYGVTFAGDAQNAGATVGADVTFGLNGYSWLLTGSLAFSGSGVARFGGGAFQVNGNISVGANRKLVLNSGTGSFLGHVDAPSAGGIIEVNGGEHTVAGRMQIYPSASGDPAFRMTGGSLAMTNAADPARLVFNSGARVSLEGGTLAVRYQTDFQSAPNAPGILDIHTNATFISAPGVGFNTSRSAGSRSIINIVGGSLILSNCNFNMVHTQFSPSAVTATGIVNLVDGLLYVTSARFGYWSNTYAVVQQTGGRLHAQNDLYLGYYTNALGRYVLEGGSAWCSQLYVGGWAFGTGEVVVAGGRLAVAGNSSGVGKIANSCGRFLQSGGDVVFSNAFTAGMAAGSYGVITNTGGRLVVNGDLNLGSSGAGAFGRAYFAGPSNVLKGTVSVGNSATDRGELIVADGVLVCEGLLRVGNVVHSTGLVSIAGGTCLVKNLTVGNAGNGTLALSGGLVAVTNGGTLMVANAAGSTANVTISGGTNLFYGQSVSFGHNGSALVRITGGYTYITNRVIFGGSVSGTGRLELVDGVLSVPIIGGRDPTLPTNPGGYSEVFFDGGRLEHSVVCESWMPGSFVSSFAKATLTGRGLVIDSNGGTLTVPQALSNEVGHAGSITKKGAGKVTLSSWHNAFTGRVVAEQGELAVSAGGGIHLCGGVAVDAGAFLNLSAAGALRDTLTAAGTVSRIDGVLSLKPGSVLTNGVGAVMGGSGVVTGRVVFASGSVYGRGKAGGTGPLLVTGDVTVGAGMTVALTGYTVEELWAGIPLVTAAGTMQVAEMLPVTLDGTPHQYWWAKLAGDGKTLTAYVIPKGTFISVR